MKTERRRYPEPPKRRLIVVPETQPYVRDDADAASTGAQVEHDAGARRDRPTVRERAARPDVPHENVAADSAGRYSHVYGRTRTSKPPRS